MTKEKESGSPEPSTTTNPDLVAANTNSDSEEFKPFVFSAHEADLLRHSEGVTDAHRIFIDKFFESGIFVLE